MRLHLFGHPDSGHAFKVRFFLAHAGIEHRYNVIDIHAPRDQRPAEFRQHARFGEVPVLLDGRRAIVQSNAILLHLAEQEQAWGAETPELLTQVREWLFWEANKIGMCLPQLRARRRVPDHGINAGAADWLKARYEHDINWLARALDDGRDWIAASSSPTVADFSLCGYLFFADEADVPVPAPVNAWLQRLSALPAWAHPYELMSGEPA